MAKGSDLDNVMQMAWDRAGEYGDHGMKHDLVRYAESNQIQDHLPDSAHGMMHDLGVAHNHEDTPNDAETGMHTHQVVKAFDLQGEVIKSWGGEDGQDAYWEGWLSTPRMDKERDITEPEAFLGAMDSYFQRRAPVSLEHNGKTLPIGHLQKAAVIRKGEVLKEAVHPTDPHDFEYSGGEGTGVWVRGVANEPEGINAIRKGNVGGMSFIASAPRVEKAPGGRYRYLELNPWIESTIAAYPINPEAVIAVSKAFTDSQPQQEGIHMTLEEIMKEAAAKVEADKQARLQAEGEMNITKADLGAIFNEFKTGLMAEIGTQIEAVKAETIPQRGEGVGRKGTETNTPEDERDADPVAYLLKKAAASSGEDETDLVDRELIGELFYRGLTEGLRD